MSAVKMEDSATSAWLLLSALEMVCWELLLGIYYLVSYCHTHNVIGNVKTGVIALQKISC